MQIHNEEVVIQIGTKRAKLRNTILDSYLKKFINSELADIQTSQSAINMRELNYVLLKFDTPVIFEPSQEILNSEFDIAIIFNNRNIFQNVTENKAIIDYKYNNSDMSYNIYDYHTETSSGRYSDLSEYAGRKIASIGFNSSWQPRAQFPVCAIIDTSNYNIYLAKNQKLSLSRRDTITSNMEFFTHSKRIEGAMHLGVQNDIFSKLVGVGFGAEKDYFDDYYPIENLDYTVEGTSIKFPSLSNTAFTATPRYCGDDVLASNISCQKANRKYCGFTFAAFERRTEQNAEGNLVINYYPLGEYNMAFDLDKYGNEVISLIYERGKING